MKVYTVKNIVFHDLERASRFANSINASHDEVKEVDVSNMQTPTLNNTCNVCDKKATQHFPSGDHYCDDHQKPLKEPV